MAWLTACEPHLLHLKCILAYNHATVLPSSYHILNLFSTLPSISPAPSACVWTVPTPPEVYLGVHPGYCITAFLLYPDHVHDPAFTPAYLASSTCMPTPRLLPLMQFF